MSAGERVIITSRVLFTAFNYCHMVTVTTVTAASLRRSPARCSRRNALSNAVAELYTLMIGELSCTLRSTTLSTTRHRCYTAQHNAIQKCVTSEAREVARYHGAFVAMRVLRSSSVATPLRYHTRFLLLMSPRDIRQRVCAFDAVILASPTSLRPRVARRACRRAVPPA